MSHEMQTLFFVSFTLHAHASIYDGRNSGYGNGDLMYLSIPSGTTTVRLEDNHITYVSKEFMDGLSLLQVIYFSRNQIQDLDDYLFSSLPHLIQVFLYGKDLTVIRKHVFSGCSGLTTLNIGGNRIHSIQAGALRDLTSLIRLYIQSNQLRSLNQSIFAPEVHPVNLEVMMHSNNWECQCEMSWLLDAWANGGWITESQSPGIFAQCSGPGHLAGRELRSLTIHELQCDATTTEVGSSKHRSSLWIATKERVQLSGGDALQIQVSIGFPTTNQKCLCRSKHTPNFN